ncbi:MAG: hypothetical protein JW810_03455 [Sedimentisphaerales bacterium]|nr:hypothetical protein [Sedimentisphaerales bacterium]
MVKRAIGIDMNASQFQAVQVTQTARGYCVEKAFFDDQISARRDPADWIDCLTAEHGFDRRAPIAWSMPHEDCYFRRLDGTSDQGSPPDIEDSPVAEAFPLPADECLTVCCRTPEPVESPDSVMLTAVAKTACLDRIQQIGRPRNRPAVLDAPIYGLLSSVMINHPDLTGGAALVMYTDRQRLLIAVLSGRQVLTIRNLPWLVDESDSDPQQSDGQGETICRELELSWRAALDQPIPQDACLLLAGQAASDDRLGAFLEESLSCRVVKANPFNRMEGNPPSVLSPSFIIAQGLALRCLDPEHTLGVNLFRARREQTSGVHLKRQWWYFALLAGSVAVVSLSAFFWRLNVRERYYQHLKEESRRLYRQSFPQETVIVDETAQLQDKVQQLRQRSAHSGAANLVQADPLGLLHILSLHTPPAAGITLQDLWVTPESIRVTATTASFQAAYDWGDTLRRDPRFATVRIKDPKKLHQSDTIQFLAEIEVAAGGAPI